MNAMSMPNEAAPASIVVVKSEKNHHFCRAPSSRRITVSAAGDILGYVTVSV